MVAVPLIVKEVIDGPLADGDRGGDRPAGPLLVAAIAVVEVFLAFGRRILLTVALHRARDEPARRPLRPAAAPRRRLPRPLAVGPAPVAGHDRPQRHAALRRLRRHLLRPHPRAGAGDLRRPARRSHVPLALLTFAAAIPVLVLCHRFERGYMAIVRRIQDQTGDLTTTIEEGAKGIRVLKAFGRGDVAFAGYQAEAQEIHDTQMERIRAPHPLRVGARRSSRTSRSPSCCSPACWPSGSGGLTLGGLVAFVSYVLMLTFPLEILAWIMALAGEAESAGGPRLRGVRHRARPSQDRPGARRRSATTCAATSASRACRSPTRAASAPVLQRHRPHGRSRARSSRSSAPPAPARRRSSRSSPASTTRPTGRITLDGHDLRDLTVTSLRRHVGFAFEEPSLFSASVRENLLMGKPDATEAEVLDAPSRSRRPTFALDLPWGLDTRIGEQGLSLSGGQRQRLALARAIIGRPRVLVLDDPLSARRRPHRGRRPGRAAADPRRAAPCSSSCTARRRSRWPTALDPARRGPPRRRRHPPRPARRPSPATAPCSVRGAERRREGGRRMTTVEPDEVPRHRSRRRPRPHRRRARRRVARRQRRGRRGGHRRARRAAAQPQPGAARRPHAPAPPRRSSLSSLLIAISVGCAPRHALARAARHRRRHPAAARRRRAATIRPLAHGRRRRARHHGRSAPSTFNALPAASLGRVGQDVVLDIRERLFLHFQRLSMSFHERYTSGRVISRQTSDVEAIADLLGHGLINLITSALLIVGIGIALLLLDLPLALVSLAVVPDPLRDDPLVPQPRRARLPGHARGGRARDRALRREPRRHPRRARLPARAPQPGDLRAPRRPLPRAPTTGRAGSPASTGRACSSSAGSRSRSCCSSARYRVLDGEMTVGVLAAFLLYLRQFFAPMEELSQFYNLFQAAAAALEKLSGVLDEDAERARARRARRRSPTPHGAGPLRRRRVRLPRAHRAPPPRPRHPGRADRSRSSAPPAPGKTTIARLAARFWDPTDGRVLLDGIDLRDLTEVDLRRAVITVTQESFLFAGSVADNIRLGRPGASRDEIEARRPGHRRPRLHRRAARRLRHRRAPEGRAALGRPAPARVVRPRLPRRPRGADPRRGDLVARRAVGAARAARPAHAARGPHRGDHRPPPHDGGDRRSRDRASTPAASSRTARPTTLIGGDGRYAALHRQWLESLA